MAVTLGKDSATVALCMVGLGATPEWAFEFAQRFAETLTGRTYDDVLTLEYLRKVHERLKVGDA